jgi:hypothetical protein
MGLSASGEDSLLSVRIRDLLKTPALSDRLDACLTAI